MADWWWSWLLTIVGVTGFIFVAQKKWWAWFINIGCQFLWVAYALISAQYGFIAASAIYFVVFSRNAYKWTREHQEYKKRIDDLIRKDLDHSALSFGFTLDKTQFDDQMRITQARLRDISLVKEPPHPSWQILSVDKEPKEPTVTPHLLVYECENPDCTTKNFTSLPNARGVGLSNDRCPGCGERSTKPLTGQAQDYGPGCGSCGLKARQKDCPCPQVKWRGRDVGLEP